MIIELMIVYTRLYDVGVVVVGAVVDVVYMYFNSVRSRYHFWY